MNFSEFVLEVEKCNPLPSVAARGAEIARLERNADRLEEEAEDLREQAAECDEEAEGIREQIEGLKGGPGGPDDVLVVVRSFCEHLLYCDAAMIPDERRRLLWNERETLLDALHGEYEPKALLRIGLSTGARIPADLLPPVRSESERRAA